jgi:toxin ParE1/3/4
MGVHKDRLTWSADAEDDMLSVWRYGADEWSPAAADDHLREINSSCERLLATSELGKARDELLAGVRSILVRPHVVFYRVSANAIEILRILHQREDIEIVFH